jgi:hypothetical protein
MRARLLLLTRLLLVEYLLLDVLVLKGTLSSIVRASMGELLLRRGRLGRHHLSSIGRSLGEVGSLSNCSLGDMVGRELLLSATVAVFGLVVRASLPLGHLSRWRLRGSIAQVCKEGLHLGHTNGVIHISSALFGRL